MVSPHPRVVVADKIVGLTVPVAKEIADPFRVRINVVEVDGMKLSARTLIARPDDDFPYELKVATTDGKITRIVTV